MSRAAEHGQKEWAGHSHLIAKDVPADRSRKINTDVVFLL